MTVKQISVFLENQPGKLAEFTKLLKAYNINLRALTIAEASDFGIIRVIVDDAYNAATVIKDNDYICKITNVIAAELKDEPGALADMITILGENDVNVEYMYACAGTDNKAYMILKVENVEATVGVLEKNGIRLSTSI